MELRIPHVRVESRGEWTAIVVDDYELFDWIDDYLHERDLGCEHVEGPSTLLVGPAVDRQAVVDALNLLDPEEVERVYQLNH
ncbi:MAG: hypothetical protein ABMA64_10665 [Myxococcota bacterium]